MANTFKLSTFLFLLIIAQICDAQSADYTKFVNPFIGTADNGHTFPGAALPFGFVQASPETGNTTWRYCSGYNYEDSLIIGFAQNHLNGTGCSDLGDLLLLPFTGKVEREKYQSRFDKKSESATPGYYQVSLADFGVKAELTATSHTAFHKYTFNKSNAHILVDLQSGVSWDEKSLRTHVKKSDIKIESNKVISGHHQLSVWVSRHLFYVIEFSKPFTINRELPLKEGEKAKRYILDFETKPGESVLVKVALSTVSTGGAKLNLKTENPGWDFASVHEKAKSTWNSLFSKVKIEGTTDQKTAFYTSLYHLYLQPSNIADVDGKYRGANDSIFTSSTKEYYSTLSLWDTYRAAHPLYTILTPEKVNNFVNTFTDHYNAVGILPIWALWGKENNCMIGNHSIPVIVDAYLKGFRGFDAEKAWQAIRKSLTTDHQKSSWKIYNQYGYYPFDLIREESVSRTLENGIDDYAAAVFAKALGKEEDYQFFMKRSKTYKNLFDPETKLMRGKDSKGNWRIPFDALALAHAGTAGGDYTEGNAWQYTWHVQQDVDGLASLLGGKEKFADKLDSLFKLDPVKKSTGFALDVSGLIGQYAHGNEPSHHVAYLYSLLGRSWRTQELVREINDLFYLNKPDGLCGNDDCGQMSAWYIFSAMGFYPVNPVGGVYVLGAPQVPEVSIALPNGKTFTVTAVELSKKNKYVQKISLNGKPYDKTSINHQDIMNGGNLVFVMGETHQ